MRYFNNSHTWTFGHHDHHFHSRDGKMPIYFKKFFYTALMILLMTDDITPVVFCLCPILGAEEKIAFVDKEIGGCC